MTATRIVAEARAGAGGVGAAANPGKTNRRPRTHQRSFIDALYGWRGRRQVRIIGTLLLCHKPRREWRWDKAVRTARVLAGSRVSQLHAAQRVAQQHGNGHWPDAARHRRDGAGHVLYLVEGHVAHQAIARLARGIRHLVDADVDHESARLDPIG